MKKQASLVCSAESVTFIDVACTNENQNSCVKLIISRKVLSWSIPNNKYGDKLPLIPSSSRVLHGKILYRQTIDVTVTSRAGIPISGHALSITSNRVNDVIQVSGPTDSEGHATITLESRDPGELSLSAMGKGLMAVPLHLVLKDAWYEDAFLITGYHVCFESDFSGEMVLAGGIGDYHKSDFLYGARGVVMQGTGKALNGRYIRPATVNSGWHRNSRGNRDYLSNPDGVTFVYANSVRGAYGRVAENHSIAVDPNVIPKRGQVDIEMVGRRFADDTGSAIIGHHIDNFVGAGAAVQAAWERGRVNNTRRRVKYLGPIS